VFLVSIFPILAAFSGRDFYCWIGIFSNISLLLIVYLSTFRRIQVSVKVLLVFLAFSCFALFEAKILERPFLAYRLLLEKFLPDFRFCYPWHWIPSTPYQNDAIGVDRLHYLESTCY